MDGIVDLDKAIFHQINRVWTHPILDQVMPVLTDLHEHLWFVAGLVPLLIALWVFTYKQRAVKAIVMMIAAIALADAISYRVIKPLVDRPRPQFSGIEVNLLTHPHSGKSFPSNHAANNFAAATILSFVHPVMTPVFFTIAFVVSYSRVYVGVHFPLDILGGAALGITISVLIWTIFGFRWMEVEKRILPPDPLRKVRSRLQNRP